MNPLAAIADDHIRVYPPARPGGKWRGAYYDSTGTRRWVSLPALNRTQADKAARRIEAVLRERPSARDGRGALTLGSWRDRWLALNPDLDKRTRAEYARSIKKVIAHFGEDRMLDTIEPDELAAWQAKLIDDGLADSTARKHGRHLRTWGRQAVRLKLVRDNPFAELKAAQRPRDTLWPWIGPAEMEKLLEWCPDWRWRRLLALARWGGLRAGEALRADAADVSADGSLLAIRHVGARTTKRRARAVPVRPELAAVLDDGPREGLLCGGLKRTRQFGPMLRAIIEAAGFAPWDQPLHTLRRCAACHWIQLDKADPWSVCGWLGHSPAVSQAWYFSPISLLPPVTPCVHGVCAPARELIEKRRKRLKTQHLRT